MQHRTWRWIRRARQAEPRKSNETTDAERRQRVERLMRSAERSVARGRLEEGIRQYLEIASQEPGDLSHLNRAGDLLVRGDRIEPAVALFLKVAAAYAEQGFWAKAIAVYRKILRCDPGRKDVEARLVWLYQRSGMPTLAGG